MNEELIELWSNTINRLITIWAEIGYSEKDTNTKARRAYASIKSKLKEMEDEEERKKKELIVNLGHLGSEVHHLTRCLQEDPLNLSQPDVELSLLELEADLKGKLVTLNKEADKRRNTYSQLKRNELELCNELCEDPSEDSENEIPSLDDLHYKKQIVDTLKVQKVQRKKTFVHLRKSIMSHMGDMQREPTTLLEKNIFNEEEDQITLSTQNLQSMKKISHNLGLELDTKRKKKIILTEEINLLSERLELPALERKNFWLSLTGRLMDDLTLLSEEKERLHEIRQQNMGKFIGQLREELMMWWNKCYASEEERKAFAPMYDDDYTEESLEQHEIELGRLKATYERDSHIFKKVNTWFELWNKVTELEEKAHDPKRLFGNRGCSLLQEEKERKRVNKLLPKTESELESLIKTAEKERDEPFLVCGLEFTEFIKTQWQRYSNSKLQDKLERQEAKTKQLQLDARIGTGKASVKRPNTTRISTQASKYIKTGDNCRTPVRNSSKQLSRCTSMSSVHSQFKPSNRLFTLRENKRRVKEPTDSTLNSSEVSSYVKFSERLQTMSERENIRSSVLIPNRLKKVSPRNTPKGLPRTPIRTGASTPSSARNVRTVPSNFGQRRSTRLNPAAKHLQSSYLHKGIDSPSMKLTPLKNKLSFLI